MRSLVLALAALAFASSAFAADTHVAGSYWLDAKGNCHGPAPKTVFAPKAKCAAPAPAPAPKHCKDPKTHKFVKCGAPGAVPA